MRFGIARPLSRLILAANTNPILVLHRVNAAYGPVRVLDGISLEVHEGECLALLGANGAGKTSLLRALTGILVHRTGEIVFHGTNIAAVRSHEIVRLGIAHIAEGKHLFGPLSVADNLELGALAVSASTKLSATDNGPKRCLPSAMWAMPKRTISWDRTAAI